MQGETISSEADIAEILYFPIQAIRRTAPLNQGFALIFSKD
jgi:hypothetical protein